MIRRQGSHLSLCPSPGVPELGSPLLLLLLHALEVQLLIGAPPGIVRPPQLHILEGALGPDL